MRLAFSRYRSCAVGTGSAVRRSTFGSAGGQAAARLVQGAQPRDGALPAPDRRPARRSDHRGAPGVPAFRAEEDQGAAGGTVPEAERGSRLAGRLDDRRHPEARRPGRAATQAPPRDRAGRDRRAGDPAERGMVDRLQGLVPHARRHTLRSADDHGRGEPLPDRGADRGTDVGRRQRRHGKSFR